MERFEVSDYSSYSDDESSERETSEESDLSSNSESDLNVNKRKRSPSTSDTEGHAPIPQVTGLALSQLYMMDGEDGMMGDESCYATSGKDPGRVKTVLQQPCCKAQCKRKLPLKLLLHMVTVFWSMTKASQDCLLWSMQQQGMGDFEFKRSEDDDGESSSSSTHHQISWSIEGQFPTSISR